MNPIMKLLGIAFAASLFTEGVAEFVGLGDFPPMVRMIIAVVVMGIFLRI